MNLAFAFLVGFLAGSLTISLIERERRRVNAAVWQAMLQQEQDARMALYAPLNGHSKVTLTPRGDSAVTLTPRDEQQ